jgi:hypothetical protein
MRYRYIIILLGLFTCNKPEPIAITTTAVTPLNFSNDVFFGVTLYYINNETGKFEPVPSLITVTQMDTLSLVKSVLNALLKQDIDSTYLRSFPPEAKIEDVFMDSEKNLYIQLNSVTYLTNLSGATAEKQMLEAILKTMKANFPAINGIQLLDSQGEVENSRLDLRNLKTIDNF